MLSHRNAPVHRAHDPGRTVEQETLDADIPESPRSDLDFDVYVQATATCDPFLKGRQAALPALNAGFFAADSLAIWC